MKILSDLTTNSKPWFLLAISALALELSALFFQYALDLAPCIMCVYQRVAIAAIFLAGLTGFLGCRFLIARVLAHVLWAVGAIWGLLIALEHVEIQSATLSFLYSCEFVPNFPNWAPLHEWLPLLFEATGDCGDIDWIFLGYTMPQMMIAVYSTFSAALAVILLARLIDKRSL